MKSQFGQKKYNCEWTNETMWFCIEGINIEHDSTNEVYIGIEEIKENKHNLHNQHVL